MKIVVVGCGVMGGALAKHFARTNEVQLYDHHKEKSEKLARETGAKVCENLTEAAKESDLILLAVKPKDLTEAAKAMSAAAKGIVLSVLAGTSLSTLKKHFSSASSVRLMPNLGLTCGEGVLGLTEDPALPEEVKHEVEALLKGLGLIVWLPESKIEALTPLAASGPAFVLVMIEAMIEAGIFMGFTAVEAQELVMKTIEGTVALLRSSKKHPAALKWDIASPAGTTIAGMKELEEQGVRAGIAAALMAAYRRNQVLLGENPTIF